MFKKHNWIRYGRSDNVITIKIKDSSEREIDSFRCNNQEDYSKIMRIIKDKYGFSPEIDLKESINYKEEEYDWMGSDEKW